MPEEKVMIDPTYSNRKNRKRIEEDEKELETLMKRTSTEEDPEESPEENPEENFEESQEENSKNNHKENPEENLSAEEKTFKKRYGDLRKYMDKKEKEWEDKFAQLETDSKNRGGIAPPKSDEDLDAWAKKYPDVAGVIESIARKRAEELFEKTNDKFKSLEEMQEEANRTKAEGLIREKHSDFDKLRESDDFHDWAEKQPKWVQTALYDNAEDAVSVVRVIDLYKLDKGITPSAKKESRKKAAEAVNTTQKPDIDANEDAKKFFESKVAKMSDKEFEDNFPAIQKAMQEGTFIYDISKKS